MTKELCSSSGSNNNNNTNSSSKELVGGDNNTEDFFVTSPNITSTKNENILSDLQQTNRRLLVYVNKNESLLGEELKMAHLEIIGLKKTVTDRDTRITELLTINRQLTEVNKTLKKDIDDLKLRDKEQDETIKTLKKEISDLDFKIEQMEDEALTQLKHTKGVNRAVNGLKKANTSLEETVARLEGIITDLNKQITKQIKDIQNKDSIIKKLVEDVEQLKKNDAQRQVEQSSADSTVAVYVYMADLCNYYLNHTLYPDVLKVFQNGTPGYINYCKKLNNDGEQPLSFLGYFRTNYAEDADISAQAAPHKVNLRYMLDLINRRNSFTHSYVPYSVQSLLKLSVDRYNHLESKNHQEVLGQMFEIFRNFKPPQNIYDTPADKTNNPFKKFFQ